MKADLKECYHWRGRAWGPGPTTIPDTLAAALGLSGPPDKPPQGKAAPTAAVIPDALKLINGVDVVRELQVIPTIGQGAAKAILAARPDGGYDSLDEVWDLCPAILKAPYTTDPDEVAAWGATD